MLAEFIQIPKEGEIVGPYLLRTHLSSSILGSFFSATHKGSQDTVLIHIIPEALLRADSRFLNRYKEVVARQKRLPDSAVLAAQELNRIAGNLVVQYPGGDYRSMNDVVLKRREPMSADAVQSVLHSMGKGLETAAKIEQMHLFLTPDFLFVNGDGEVFIAGVGLFQSISYSAFERFVSGAIIPIQIDKNKTFEAIEILSPEIRNFKKRDQRSDFYAIGMCAYFMLTGSKPASKWQLPSTVRKDIDSGWDLFISHCLEPKPSDRFPHYRSFIRDLARIEDLAADPVSAGDDRKMMRTLDRIPVPAGFERTLGLRSLFLVRLVMLSLAGVLAVGTAALLRHIIVSDLDAPYEASTIRRVDSSKAANLIIRVSPSIAMVNISGTEKGNFIVHGDDLMLFGRSGNYTVQVNSPKRRKQTANIQLDASEPVLKEFFLPYNFGSVRVEGVVGTDIYVESASNLDLFLGTITSEEGLEISDRLLRGKYLLIGRHPSYLPYRAPSVQLAAQPSTVTLEQVPRPTELIVDSDPGGASVYIGDSMVGLTPLRVEGLEYGVPIDVRVEKEGFRTLDNVIEFSMGESRTLDIGALVPKVGEFKYKLEFSMGNPPPLDEFTLTINDEAYPLSDSFQTELPEGEYRIFLSHPDYFSLEETFDILDMETTSLKITPRPRPMRLMPEVADDFPARFQLADEEIELTEEGALLVPAFQRVKVSVSIRNYHDVIQWFEGGANELREWKVPLKRLSGPEKGKDYSPPYFDIPLVWIRPVPFELGSPVREPRRLPNEDSITTVTFDYGYWIGTTEITQKVYENVMGSNPSAFPGDQLPVDSVSWTDAVEFCRRLTEFEKQNNRLPVGYIYRLPTEAEWEYAARAETSTPFSFGPAADPTMGNFHGSYAENGKLVGKSAEDRYGTLPVRSFPENPFGLFDVHGNVAEWVLDRYWDRHPGGAVLNPFNNKRGRGHTLRGGSWEDSADRVRTAAREGAPDRTSRNSIGFRVVIAPDPENL